MGSSVRPHGRMDRHDLASLRRSGRDAVASPRPSSTWRLTYVAARPCRSTSNAIRSCGRRSTHVGLVPTFSSVDARCCASAIVVCLAYIAVRAVRPAIRWVAAGTIGVRRGLVVRRRLRQRGRRAAGTAERRVELSHPGRKFGTMTDVVAAPAHRAAPTRAPSAYVGAPVRRREEREAELAVMLAPGATRPVGAGTCGRARRRPTRAGSASSATSTGSSTPGPGGAWPASARCSSPRRTTTSAPASPTRSRSPRSPPGSPAPPTCACRSSRPSRSPTTAATAPRATPPRRRSRRTCPGGGYDHAVYGADVTLAPLNLCVETLDGVRNHSWRRPAPSTPEGEVVAWADRIAYVCHDFEDAVRAGILEPADLPADGARRRRRPAVGADRRVHARGARRRRPHRRGRDDRARRGGARRRSAPSTSSGSTCGPAARRQADAGRRACSAISSSTSPTRRAGSPTVRDGEVPAPVAGSPEAAALAVHYVSGMTDRYALGLGVELLGWRPDDLPRGV